MESFPLDMFMLESNTPMFAEDDEPDASDVDSEDTSKIVSVPRRPRKGGKKRCLQTSEGLTRNMQYLRMRKVRRERKYMNIASDYVVFQWVDTH